MVDCSKPLTIRLRPVARGDNQACSFATAETWAGRCSSSSSAQQSCAVRFGDTTQAELERAMSSNMLAAATNTKIRWAVKLYNEWASSRGVTPLENVVEVAAINEQLSRFVLEVRRTDGESYPPCTLYQLVVCLQRALKDRLDVKVLKDSVFKPLQATLDTEMKRLTSLGLNKVKSKELIDFALEERLWQSGALGSTDPHTLLDTLVFVFGKHFALRGKAEHRNLKWRNLLLQGGNRSLIFEEDCSKTNRGGLLHRKVKGRAVEAFAYGADYERCPVKLFLKYRSLCPSVAVVPDGAFYLTPKKVISSDVWFTSVPVGVNRLCGAVKRICSRAGVKGNYTNHSLRSTYATRLFGAGVEEQLIQEGTGHRSLEALRAYKRSDGKQRELASRVVEGASEDSCVPRKSLGQSAEGGVAGGVIIYNYGNCNVMN